MQKPSAEMPLSKLLSEPLLMAQGSRSAGTGPVGGQGAPTLLQNLHEYPAVGLTARGTPAQAAGPCRHACVPSRRMGNIGLGDENAPPG